MQLMTNYQRILQTFLQGTKIEQKARPGHEASTVGRTFIVSNVNKTSRYDTSLTQKDKNIPLISSRIQYESAWWLFL